MSLYYDGCFPDAPLILTEEEYFDKVIFDQELLQPFSRFFHWIINDKQGYVQNGEFKEKNFKWALIYERVKNDDSNDDDAFAFNFGDLLVYLPVNERLEWKRFYQDTDIKIDYGDKLLLLFFDKNNDQESGLVSKYWAKRIENLEQTEDLPWWTKRQKEQLSEELHFLKQPDPQTGEYRDIKLKYFRRKVLDKYRNRNNDELCKIGSGYISFLRQQDKKTSASTVRFDSRNFANIDDDGIVLVVQAQNYIYVPPTERPHWEHYEIPKSQIQF
jgi:hypothetical protein